MYLEKFYLKYICSGIYICSFLKVQTCLIFMMDLNFDLLILQVRDG
jgi:hypothetical protein